MGTRRWRFSRQPEMQQSSGGWCWRLQRTPRGAARCLSYFISKLGWGLFVFVIMPSIVLSLKAVDSRLRPHAHVSDSAGSGRAPSVPAQEPGVRPSASLSLAGSGRAEAGFGTGPEPPGEDSSYGACPVGRQATGKIPDPGVILCTAHQIKY